MIAENQIREKLGRYLRQEMSLDQFEDWIAQQSWNMHKDSNDAAQKLASAIEMGCRNSSGHLDEPTLREELRQFANPPVVRIHLAKQHCNLSRLRNSRTMQPSAQIPS